MTAAARMQSRVAGARLCGNCTPSPSSTSVRPIRVLLNLPIWKPLDDGPIFAAASSFGVGTGSSSARLMSRPSDGSRVTILATGSRESTTLSVAPEARAQVTDLREGDTVQISVIPGGHSEVRAIAVKTISISARRRVAAMALSFAIVLGLLWLLHASPRRLILGEDGRYSKSKFQVAAWFVALIASYLTTVGLRWWTSDWTLVSGVGIPTDLLVISGISAFTFVGAKGVTVSKIAQSPAFAAAKQMIVPSHFPDDLVNDDRGNPDLGDAQMVLIALIAVVTYIVTVFSWLGGLQLSGQIQMPDVDSTLVAVFGLGQGAYLAKKQIGA
jgi:hypothetical protein